MASKDEVDAATAARLVIYEKIKKHAENVETGNSGVIDDLLKLAQAYATMSGGKDPHTPSAPGRVY
jgi:NADH/NAD ratio-sensing transcriptional regulator Rex